MGIVETAAYTVSGTINAIVDGMAMSIPDDMANRDRRKLAAWEAEGGVIAAYVAPEPTAGEVRKAEFKVLADRADMVTRLKTATPEQIDTWLTNNVTNLAQARTVLGAIIKYLATMNGD